MKAAHTAGQYQSLVDEAELYPYWQYHTREDDRVRGSHAVLNRKVFRWDDPFWNTHFPPNGWQCRCYVRSLNERGLKRQGLSTDDVLDSSKLKTREDKSAGGHSKLTYIIDGKDATTADGWNYNPGKVSQQIDNVADNKIGEYDAELGQQVKDDLKKEEELKPAAPNKPSAAPGQPAQPSEPAKKTGPEKKAEPEKKAAPKSAADKTNKTKASGKSETKPAALPAKPEAAAPKPAQQTVKDSNVPVKSTAAASKPAQPAVKPAAAPKPKQADGAHGELKPTAASKPIKPAPALVNRPAAPRVVEPVKPADPSMPRVVKPIKPIDPSTPRVVEPVKPEAKQGILQTIRGKVSRAVDRVLGWLGAPSKLSSSKMLANESGQDTYYGNFQPKESQSTAAKNAITAHPQQRDQQTAVVKDNNVPGKPQSDKTPSSQGNTGLIILKGKTLSSGSVSEWNTTQSDKLNNNNLIRETTTWEKARRLFEDKTPFRPRNKSGIVEIVRQNGNLTIISRDPIYERIKDAEDYIRLDKEFEHCLVFDANKQCFCEAIGSRNVINLISLFNEPAFIARCARGTVTHNHPDNTNMGGHDIQTAIQLQVSKLRAIVDDGVYSFAPTVKDVSQDLLNRIAQQINDWYLYLNIEKYIKGKNINIQERLCEIIQELCYNGSINNSIGSYKFIPEGIKGDFMDNTISLEFNMNHNAILFNDDFELQSNVLMDEIFRLHQLYTNNKVILDDSIMSAFAQFEKNNPVLSPQDFKEKFIFMLKEQIEILKQKCIREGIQI